MNNDNIQSNHRGSSPPFQDPERDFYDWMKGLQSVDQRDEKATAIQVATRPGNGKTISNNLIDSNPRQSKDGESRWQDDGGESGEVL